MKKQKLKTVTFKAQDNMIFILKKMCKKKKLNFSELIRFYITIGMSNDPDLWGKMINEKI